MKNLISKIRNPKVLRAILMLVLIGIITGGYVYFQKTRGRISVENSVISAPVIAIVPSAPGKLFEFDAVEGHAVKTGDTLAVVGTETLRAQTDGIIIAANNQTGGNVSVVTPLIQMIRTEDMRVAGTIDENKGLNDIKVGQVVSFSIDALPGQTFWGYVDEIAPSAKQTQLSFSISSERPTQQFQIFARYNAAAYPQIKNGMSAKMTVYTNDR
jgi:multidrug resistance efflux pump